MYRTVLKKGTLFLNRCENLRRQNGSWLTLKGCHPWKNYTKTIQKLYKNFLKKTIQKLYKNFTKTVYTKTIQKLPWKSFTKTIVYWKEWKPHSRPLVSLYLPPHFCRVSMKFLMILIKNPPVIVLLTFKLHGVSFWWNGSKYDRNHLKTVEITHFLLNRTLE